jgi:CRISPR-associated endonuclease Csn1
MKKTILGLDLGTNSIGWALINKSLQSEEDKIIEINEGSIIDIGSRIIPMSQDILGDFEKGNSVSQTAARTEYRGVRRLHERNLLRRERLHRVLNVLGFLPQHFAEKLDDYGNFKDAIEIKLPYFLNENNKHEFLFKKSYLEMVADFKINQPQLFFTKANGEESKIPYDWTIYYLRKKALTQKIEKEELAWLLLHFNQKRGYYQLRGEDEEKKEDNFEIITQKVISVTKGEKDKKYNKYEYTCALENGLTYKASFYSSIDHWVGQTREFILTYKTRKDYKTKVETIEPSLSFLPTIAEIEAMDATKKAKMYGKIKIKTEKEISDSNKTVGTFIYDTILQIPNQKIKGKLVRTIERNFYKEELQKIIATQINFHAELQNKNNYKKCCDVLYESNETYKNSIAHKDFNYLFVEDILFYQRPLKSKKSEISDCTLEYRKYKLNGEEKTEALKCIAKSHPLFQEFRIWQWISNVKIFERNPSNDIEVTKQFLDTETQKEKLFEFLNERKEIDQTTFLKYILEPQKLKGKALNDMVAKYRWNYIDDNEKTYPCNTTHNNIKNRLSKVGNVPEHFFSQENEIKLWHILYSVTDKNEIVKALNSFISKYNASNNTQINQEQFVENLKKYPIIKSEYGSYSEKAIKKLLPLMRLGKYWEETSIINHIDTYQKNIEIVLETINKRENTNSKVKDELLQLDGTIDLYKGLRKEIATYLVYQKHSEASDTDKWNTAQDLEKYLKSFKQHSLRNPIVEQVITETLRVVKDIWVQYGNGEKDFFSEIHIELGREMKNNAADRKAITEKNMENENTNLRIRTILAELQNLGVEKVLPNSPHQLEAFKIFEDFALKSEKEIPEDVIKISKSSNPSSAEILRYKLWLEQKYRSPYTGQVIPLSKLFTTAYEIEHIIPQSIYFDDSFSNKVICESEVNKAKDKMFGLEYIKNPGLQKIPLNGGGYVTILNEEQYRDFISKHYDNNKAKAKKLLLEEVPEKMIERQLNDTRYISKIIKNLLSKLVRQENNDEGVTANNLLSTNGTITSILKQDWGLNDVWNDLMLPRFERLNELTKTTDFTYYNTNHQKHLPTVPDSLRKGYQLKRIDHRHHAMDALVIACTTRSHINFLNNQSALDKNKKKEEKQNTREDLKRQLCYKTKSDAKGNYKWQFHKPWETITQETKESLEKVIISFKQNIRVINKTVNFYQKFIEGKKQLAKQTQGENWAIRKPLHKETVYGKVSIKANLGKTISINNAIDNWQLIIDKTIKNKITNQIKTYKNDLAAVKKYFKENPLIIEEKNIDKIKVYEWVNGTASRVALDDSFTEEKIKTSITDTAIQKILLNHLTQYKNKLDDKGKEILAQTLAFSPEGIEEMNKNILALNNGTKHQPIYKVRVYEAGNRFAIGTTGNKKDKFVEAAKGTNLYFAIYQDERGKRNYDTIPLNIVIERLKQDLSPVPEKEGNTLLFHISPNDLVYIPTEEEKENISNIDFNKLSKEQVQRIYKMVSSTGNQCMFIKAEVATSIYNKFEFSSLNKMEKSIDGIMIKEACIKLMIDRLGKIKSVYP